MSSGYSFRPISQVMNTGVSGLQIGFDNDYGVSILPDSYSEDERMTNATVAVFIFKGARFNETTENMIVPVMKRLGHQPTFDDMELGAITKVSPSYLIKILDTVSKMEIQ